MAKISYQDIKIASKVSYLTRQPGGLVTFD